MPDFLITFLKNYQEGNNMWIILALIIIAIALGIYVIIILGTRSANKIICDREAESTKLIFNNIYANICKRIRQNKEISDEEAVVYVFAGEQNYKTYQQLIPIVKNFLDNVLEKTRKIRIISVAGTKLMAKKLTDDFTEIHPSMKLLSDEKYKNHIEFYLVRDCRMPYHFFYSPIAESGIAEIPHRELSTPINWMFENKKEYKLLFRNWFNLLKEKYHMIRLVFREKELFYQSLSEGSEKKVKEKKEIFFLKTSWLKIKTYFHNETLIQCGYHSDKTGLLMRNWHPYSSTLFTKENKKILLSANYESKKESSWK